MDDCFRLLGMAVEAGRVDGAFADEDVDLVAPRSDARWASLRARMG